MSPVFGRDFKTKSMRLIDLHKEWCEFGGITNSGLCTSIDERKDLKTLSIYFEPTFDESKQLIIDGFDEVYWGSGLPNGHEDEMKTYTPLRQTIVLLICAMNNEL